MTRTECTCGLRECKCRPVSAAGVPVISDRDYVWGGASPLPTDAERLDWLERQINETHGFDDLLLRWDYEDGVFIHELRRGEAPIGRLLSGHPKTTTLREAIDAAIAAARPRAPGAGTE